MRDAQEFIKILDSETPDFELIRMKFISLCIQGKNLKSTIAQYCEMKCDTDIIDRISKDYYDQKELFGSFFLILRLIFYFFKNNPIIFRISNINEIFKFVINFKYIKISMVIIFINLRVYFFL